MSKELEPFDQGLVESSQKYLERDHLDRALDWLGEGDHIIESLIAAPIGAVALWVGVKYGYIAFDNASNFFAEKTNQFIVNSGKMHW